MSSSFTSWTLIPFIIRVGGIKAPAKACNLQLGSWHWKESIFGRSHIVLRATEDAAKMRWKLTTSGSGIWGGTLLALGHTWDFGLLLRSKLSTRCSRKKIQQGALCFLVKFDWESSHYHTMSLNNDSSMMHFLGIIFRNDFWLSFVQKKGEKSAFG